MKSLKLFFISTTLIALALLVINSSAQNKVDAGKSGSGYHLIKKIEIGGEGGWDYLIVDSDAKRLYVPRSTRVDVIDIEAGKKVGEVPNTSGVHGVALDIENGRGYSSNGRDTSVTIFDLKSLKEISKVKVEKNPDAIIYDPTSKRVFSYNRGSSSVTAIDCATGKAVGTLALGGHPEFSSSDGKGMMYVNLDDKSEVVAFDAKKLEIKYRWPITPGESASGMAIDQKNGRLFLVCENKKMIVFSTSDGKVVADLPIGEGTDGAAFDPTLKLAFSANGRDGTLTVVQEESENKFSIVENVITQKGARTIALDAKTHNVYLPTAQFGPPPAPTAERPTPRPSVIPNSFVILVFGK